MNTYYAHAWIQSSNGFTAACKYCGQSLGSFPGIAPCKRNSVAASCCGGASLWNIDKSQWECEKCKSAVSNDPNYLYAPGSGVISAPKDYRTIKKESEARRCVCGGAKANTTHAHWCEVKN